MTIEKRIANEYVEAVISQQAAEVISFKRKDNGIEMIWCRNPEFWYNCNPILFPYTGRLKDDHYFHNGQEYSLGQHGFARRALFEFTDVKDDEVTLTLTDNEETRAVYPFHFSLSVNYRLEGYRIVISYTVENTDEAALPFELGFHPAFNCPMTPDKVYEDYRIEFEKEEDLHHENKPHLTTGSSFDLKDTLQSGSFFYRNNQIRSSWVQLTDGDHTLRVGTAGFSVLGFWRKTTETPFMCIEPWSPYSNLPKGPFFRDDYQYNLLPSGQQYHCSYYFEIIA